MVKIVNGKNSRATKIIIVDSAKLPQLSSAVASKTNFKGHYKSYLYLATDDILLVGSKWKNENKNCDPYDKPDYFELGALSYREIEDYSPTAVVISNLSSKPIDNEQISRFALGLMQANWKYDKYLPTKSKQKELTIHFDLALNSQLNSKQQKQLLSLNDAITNARKLIETTPEELNPSTIAALVREILPSDKFSLKVHNSTELAKLKMNAVLAVGRGSQHAPVMLHATLNPSAKIKKTICLVGKGITYDSGGMDIKTGGHMRTMKMDMAGAATMLASIKAASGLDLVHTQIHFIVPFAENMVAANSYKSDDIISTYSGQTVEVRNTDAEGRLTLADALAYATTLKPDYIIDAATLTGAAIAAVSPFYTAVMGNDGQLIEEIINKYTEEGEFAVQTPLPEVLRQFVMGNISDLINTSSLVHMAGHLTAGLFLSHFVDPRKFRNPDLKSSNKEPIPWVHLDIAGSAYNEGYNKLATIGATGSSVRALVSWISAVDKLSK